MRRATSTLALLFGSGCTLIGGISDYEVARCVGSSCDAGTIEGGLRDACAGEECSVDGGALPLEGGGSEAGFEGGPFEAGMPEGGQVEAGVLASPIVAFQATGTLASVALTWTVSTTSPVSGFRIRRDNQLLVEPATGSTSYEDQSAQPGRLSLDEVTATQGTRSDGVELQWQVSSTKGLDHEYAITVVGADGTESAPLTSTAARIAPPDWTISWQRLTGMDNAETLPGTQTSTLDTLAPLASVSTSVAVATADYSRGVIQLRGSVEVRSNDVLYKVIAYHSEAFKSERTGTGARGGKVDDLALLWQRAPSQSATYAYLSGATGIQWYDNAPTVGVSAWYRLRASASWVSEADSIFSSAEAAFEASTSIAAGAHATCVRRASGALSCWGDTSQGPTGLTGAYQSIAMSGKSGCGINAQFTPVCWGPVASMNPPIGTYSRVAVGPTHACGLWETGKLSCWGANDDGQAPPGPSTQTYRDVAAGVGYTCAVREADGSLDCFGANDRGEAPARTTSTTYSRVSAGNGYTCGLRGNNRLDCFGRGLEGTTLAGPIDLEYADVSLGLFHACAIRVDNKLATCWGNTAKGESSPPVVTMKAIALGAYHSCALSLDGRALCWGSNEKAQAPPLPPFSKANAVAMGDTFGCSATDQGLECWGVMDSAQSLALPTGAFTSVGAGSNHVCAVKTNGEVGCAGFNGYGQATPPSTPGQRFTAVAAGDYHSCGLLESGKVVCWGDNSFLQAPPGPSSEAYADLASRGYSTCGLRVDGTRVCWGQVTSAAPSAPSVEKFRRLALGWSHGCGVTSSGALVCWGDVASQQISVQAGETFSDVAAGDGFTCALGKDTRRIKCWGGPPLSSVPDEPFLSVHAARLAACGLRIDGKVLCWGDNSLGQAPRL